MAGGGALGGISQWMALMAEHMSHDQARLPFLWPPLNAGKPELLVASKLNMISLAFKILLRWKRQGPPGPKTYTLSTKELGDVCTSCL